MAESIRPEPVWPDLARLLPSVAAPDWVVATRRATPDPAATSPFVVERDAVARAVPSRRQEFLTGRALAHDALREIGEPDGPLARRADRSPDWPPGVLGSITHTGDLCAVVVARPASGAQGASDVIGVGIDAERDQVLDEAVVRRVLTSAERDALGDRLDRDAVVAFSAKEALFKAINPATGVWLEPNEVELEVGRDAADGPGEHDGGPIVVRSWARAAPGVVPTGAVGRWARFGPWVATGFVLHAASRLPAG